jgi:quercetin dioxygenase-like cupin family protein
MTTSGDQQHPEGREPAPTTFDLFESLDRLKREPAWLDGQDRTLLLTNSASMRVVMRALHAGAGLGIHKADGQISVQVLQGRIEFIVGGLKSDMRQGQLLLLPGGTPHSLRAIDESAILITMAVDQVR